MIQDYNAQNKLLTDEWSFQGLPLVLSRRHILLQTPTVVGQKLYIPSTLIAFLHATKIFVKVSTILRELVQMRKKKVYFHWHSCIKFSEILHNHLLILVVKEVDNDWFQRQPCWEFNGIQWFIKLASFMSSLIWIPSNTPALSFSMLSRLNFSQRKIKPLPSLFNAFTKFFMSPSLMCRVEAISCSDQLKGRTVLIFVLLATVVWHRAECQPDYSTSTQSTDS